MESHSADDHKCPGCGRQTINAPHSHPDSSRPRHCRRLYCVGTLLLLIPALAPLWLGPLTHAFVGFPQGNSAGWIVEEVGKRFLFAAVSTASAITGAYLFTSALKPRVTRKPGI